MARIRATGSFGGHPSGLPSPRSDRPPRRSSRIESPRAAGKPFASLPRGGELSVRRLHWSIFTSLAVYNYSTLLGGPLGEEPGWRGYALPRLEQALGPVRITPIAMHAIFNTVSRFLSGLFAHTQPSARVPFELVMALYGLATGVVLIVATRGRLAYRGEDSAQS